MDAPDEAVGVLAWFPGAYASNSWPATATRTTDFSPCRDTHDSRILRTQL
ncbi:MAG: hypothetical protein IT425_08690 [Pirellulales bacterium]|nr:hypothetical protein [Pirellulales bacterium]